MSAAGLASKLEELRAAFDRTFAAAEQDQAAAQHVDVLAIRVADQGYALRLAEVLAVHAERKLVPVPSPAPELLGLVGLRGLVAPVYDLRQLLGHAAGPTPRWLVLARGPSAIGFAFDALDQHLRVPLVDVVMPQASEAGGTIFFAPGSVLTPSGPRPLLHLPTLIERVTHSQAPHGAAQREGPR
ncbi:MAG: chemotaxis protein CheW [Myxococcales bacterium]